MNFLYKEGKFWLPFTGVFLVCLFLLIHAFYDYQTLQDTAIVKTTMFSWIVIACFFVMLFFFGGLFYQRNRKKLETLVYVDPVTGGDTLQSFYKHAEKALKIGHSKPYVLVYTNIRNFKMLNEQFGYENCDTLLQAIYVGIEENLIHKETIGRETADRFYILLEYQNKEILLNRFMQWYDLTRNYMKNNKGLQWMYPEMVFGIYVVEDHTIPLRIMLDRAMLALRNAEIKDYETRLRYAFYDDTLRCQLLRERQILEMMNDALREGEFQVYLQPKYRLSDEKLIGAEALVRWVSESEGMIYPNEFIPLFEKNGFIVQLDLWVFEEVCRLLREWLDQGIEPVKISINCSRIHFKQTDFMKAYIDIAKSYNIPRNLIEIELTESLAFEDIEKFTYIIEEIHKAGFGCSVDDFGSGYSSLSIIEKFPVDTMKLDQTFFRSSKPNNKRFEAVISSIISMARALSMKTVAEGVEEREQVELLKRLGCDYVQGYVFAKPMPVKEFEPYLYSVNQDIK